MKKKVLVVDDDLGILEVMIIVLEEHGFEPRTLSEPEKLRDSLQKFLPDILLMDVWMSGYDGVELAKELKKDSQFGKLPIIIISAKSDNELKNVRQHVDDVIEKPFDIDDLIRRINLLIGEN